MNIGVYSWSNREGLSNITWSIMRDYCDRHGYCFTGECIKYIPDVAESWMKLKMLQQQENLDYIIWFDDDVVLTELNKPITDFVEQIPDKCTFGVMRDSGTTNQKNRFIFNMGVLFVRCSETSIDLLENLWEGGINSRWRNKKLWEQDYITHRYKNDERLRDMFHLFPYRSIQTFDRPYGLPEEYKWRQGDFAAHVTGNAMNNKLKIKRVKSLIQRINNL